MALASLCNQGRGCDDNAATLRRLYEEANIWRENRHEKPLPSPRYVAEPPIKLDRFTHDYRSLRSGQFIKSESCDGCGKPVGTNYFTDDEVCGGGDGPGFYLCERAQCAKSREGLGIEERRALYERTRRSNE